MYSLGSIKPISEFVEKNGELSNVEEDVMLRLVRNKGGKVFAHNTMPIGRVLFVEKSFDEFADFLFGFLRVDSSVDLLLDVVLHLLLHLADNPRYVTFCHFDLVF